MALCKNKCPKYILKHFEKSQTIILNDIARAVHGIENEFGYISLNEYAYALGYIQAFKIYSDSLTMEDFQKFLELHEGLEQTVGLILNLPQLVVDWIEERRDFLGLGEPTEEII